MPRTIKQDKHHLEDTVLNLSDYLSAVSMVVSDTFNHKIWVKAEIRSLSSKSGHYYFELAEKSDDGKVIASCRATLWRYQASKLFNKFRQATGSELTANLTVMLKVAANFHSLYGFSLNIDDIDPNYTLGDLARQYTQMIKRLDSQGLLDANKQIPKPFDIQTVLVIAPENAAGLGDFRKESDLLEQHGICQFHYYHATFQGNHAPKEIRDAITLAFKQLSTLPDIVVIIRGGGAVGDLAYLNDYELAALVAKLPVPVWVGIGHERDRVILDEVAQRSFDTPSKVVATIINQLRTITQQAKQAFISIQTSTKHLTNQANHLCRGHIDQVKQHAFYELKSTTKHINQQLLSLKKSAYLQISNAKNQTQHLQQMILIQHPKHVLQQGYVLVKDNQGQIIGSVNQLHMGQPIQLEFKDGKINAIIVQEQP